MELNFNKGYARFQSHVNPGLVTLCEWMQEPYRVLEAQGMFYRDEEGRLLSDFLAGWGTQALGHRPKAVVEALQQYLSGSAPGFFTSAVSPVAGLLAERLCERSGVYDRCWFGNGGTEAVEAAIKMARAATGRGRILCLRGAYHGCTMGSLAMMEPGHFRDAFGPHLPMVEALPYNDEGALKAAVGAGDVAALVMEPIQIEGGVRAPSESYLALLAELAESQGLLLIADEIQTGLGRTGRFLHSASWPRRPDVVVLGKSLGGGLIPISAIVMGAELQQRAYGQPWQSEDHNSTFSGNGLACVAALAALEELSEDLFATVRAKAERWWPVLGELEGHEMVAAVRGEGLLLGIELRQAEHPYLSFEYLGLENVPASSPEALLLVHRLFRQGYITNICGHRFDCLRVQPPLIVSDEQLRDFTTTLRAQLDWLADRC